MSNPMFRNRRQLSSAQYIENGIKEMGLKTIGRSLNGAGSHLGILASLSQPDTDIPDNFFDEFSKYINDGFKKQNKGVNVIAVSPGKSDRVILGGAHRDNVPGCGTGAYDNASGTVSMLQIARVFSKIEHDHTFVFVS
jgi:Zn-dependent M28 family amino/carboxypeptidase